MLSESNFYEWKLQLNFVTPDALKWFFFLSEVLNFLVGNLALFSPSAQRKLDFVIVFINLLLICNCFISMYKDFI